MIFAILQREAKIGAQEGRSQFGDQLFAGITGIAKAGASKIAVKAGFVARPVGALMGQCGVIVLRSAVGRSGLHGGAARWRGSPLTKGRLRPF